MMKKILVILTGGTICSVADDNGENRTNAATVRSYLTEHFKKKSRSPYRDRVEFHSEALSPDILSENMTPAAWGEIIEIIKDEGTSADISGIIILHGTDTLAYTAAFLSLALAGIKIPVMLVSAQLPLLKRERGALIPDGRSNGYANFRMAVDLIMGGVAPNVYVPYRNEKGEGDGRHRAGKMLVHYGAHLTQCKNGTNNFESKSEMRPRGIFKPTLNGALPFGSEGCLFEKIDEPSSTVLYIKPYTGLNYSRIMTDGVSAVVHGTYHSESVCIGRARPERRAPLGASENYALSDITGDDRPYSILALISACEAENIPVFLAPCDGANYSYGTTGNALRRGAVPLPGITVEAAYAKAVLGSSIGLFGGELVEFMKKPINREMPEA